MKRGQSRLTPSADLLVCFPPRTHLTTIPIPSPARASGDAIIPTTRRRRRSNSIGGSGSIIHSHRASGGDGQKNNREDQFSEPSSPKVTCSGQVKGRRRSGGSCRGWNSVMQEIERVHAKKKEQKKKRGSWGDSFGIKKDVLQFLSCLRSFKFDFRCLGSFHGAAISSEDEDEDEDGRNQENVAVGDDVLSRWLMVLNEDGEDNIDDRGLDMKVDRDDGMRDEDCAMQAPPANALLLMRCRSAPGKGWGDERREKLDLKKENGKEFEEEEKEEKKEERKSLEILMRYDAGFGKLSSDIAKETWVVGGFQDPLSRSRSWKR